MAHDLHLRSRKMNLITIEIENLDATFRVGRRLGAALGVGHVLALTGPLGSGKTTLVKGIADGADVGDLRQVNSPTFVIVNEYEAGGRFPSLRLYHVDACRLRVGTDLEALGIDEMYAEGAVLIEWADKVTDILPADRLAIDIEPIDENRRRFHCTATGPAAQSLLASIQPDDEPSRRH